MTQLFIGLLMRINLNGIKRGNSHVDLLNGLDLFSGIGGISEALAPWVRTVAYCEREPSAQRILLSRMSRGEIELAPIWDDVTTLRGSYLPPIDVITGGFPCQDLSVAGLRKGLGAERSGLFRHILRLAKETKAPILFLENVSGISKFVPAIRNEIEALGYEVRDGFLEASDVGARHRRKRWFGVAYSHRFARAVAAAKRRQEDFEPAGALAAGALADVNSARMALRRPQIGFGAKKPFSLDLLEGDNWDDYARFLLRMDHGLQHRSDSIRALGNGVVPTQVKAAWQTLSGVSE